MARQGWLGRQGRLDTDRDGWKGMARKEWLAREGWTGMAGQRRLNTDRVGFGWTLTGMAGKGWLDRNG